MSSPHPHPAAFRTTFPTTVGPDDLQLWAAWKGTCFSRSSSIGAIATIIGCAMEVHRILGNGFQEAIYQRALAKEMTLRGIFFSREHKMEICSRSLPFKPVMKPNKSQPIKKSHKS